MGERSQIVKAEGRTPPFNRVSRTENGMDFLAVGGACIEV